MIDGRYYNCETALRQLKDSSGIYKQDMFTAQALYRKCTKEHEDCRFNLSRKQQYIETLEIRNQQQGFLSIGLSVMCFTLTWIVAMKK